MITRPRHVRRAGLMKAVGSEKHGDQQCDAKFAPSEAPLKGTDVYNQFAAKAGIPTWGTGAWMVTN